MPLSYRNIIDGGQLSSALGSGDFNLKNSLKKPNKNAAKYIKGYANQTAIEALANSLNVNNATVKQAFGIEEKKLDDYDPYHTQDAKREKFWYDDSGNVNLDAKKIQKHLQNSLFLYFFVCCIFLDSLLQGNDGSVFFVCFF